MDADSATCPHCTKVIEPRPKRKRKCPHCREPVVPRQGALLTEADAKALDGRKKEQAAPEPAPPEPEPEGDEPRFVRFRVFRSTLTTWESLFAEAAEFADEVGPERLITISHSADNGEGVVAVWYWDGPEWGGVGANEQDGGAEQA
jgi:hypothetical protein